MFIEHLLYARYCAMWFEPCFICVFFLNNNSLSGKSTHRVFIYSNFTDKATKANRR